MACAHWDEAKVLYNAHNVGEVLDMMCVNLPATAKSSEVESDDMTTLLKGSAGLVLFRPCAALATHPRQYNTSPQLSLSCHLQRFKPE